MFSVFGKLGDVNASVNWDNGKVTGFPLGVVDIFEATRDGMVKSDVSVTAPGMSIKADDWDDPLSFLFFAHEVFSEVTQLMGDIPQMPEVPEGAVA